MKILLPLNNDKLLVLNNAMHLLDRLMMADFSTEQKMILSICTELRTELLQKAIKNRDKTKSYIVKLNYYKAAAIFHYINNYPHGFEGGSYEINALMQIKNEIHRQL